jgi:hypothetical protein
MWQPHPFWFILSAICIGYLLTRPQPVQAAPAPIIWQAGDSLTAPQPITTYNAGQTFQSIDLYGKRINVPVGAPVTAQPTAEHWSWSVGPTVTDSAGGDVVKYTPPATATTANPSGYIAEVVNGQPQLTAHVPAAAVPPLGSATSAAAAATGAASAGAAGLAKVVPLGAGSGSLASVLAKGLLKAPAAVLLSPPVAIALTAYSVYDLVKTSGLMFGADGTVSTLAPTVGWGYQGRLYDVDPKKACEIKLADFSGISNFSADFYQVSPTVIDCLLTASGYGTRFYTGQLYAVDLPTAAAAAATSAQIDSAADYLTQNPTVARDIANAYIKSGMPLYNDVTMGSQSPATSFKSPFAETKSETDSIGNTRKELGRTVVDIPAGTPSSPLAQKPTATTERIFTTNGTSTGTSSSPLAVSVPSSPTKPKDQADLCADHPEILACADITKVSDVPDLELTKKDINVAFNPVNVSSIASCPAPIVIPAAGIFPPKVLEFSMICGFLVLLKPLVLTFAALSAGMIVFVGRPYGSV